MIRTSQWPPHPSSVPQARRFATDALAGLPRDRLAVLELLISEVATNSVVHARSAFTLRLEANDHEVRIEVTDGSPGRVAPQHPRPSEPHGRGLHIVQRLADRWGVRPAGHVGKTVWFVLSIEG